MVEYCLKVENLFKNLQKDPKSVFYSTGNLSKSILNKANKSVYEKDKVFVNLYKPLEDKNFDKKLNVPLVTPFFTQKMMLTIQLFIVLVSLLIWYMEILLIPDFWRNLLLIQNIVYYWLIYLLLRYTYLQ